MEILYISKHFSIDEICSSFGKSDLRWPCFCKTSFDLMVTITFNNFTLWPALWVLQQQNFLCTCRGFWWLSKKWRTGMRQIGDCNTNYLSFTRVWAGLFCFATGGVMSQLYPWLESKKTFHRNRVIHWCAWFCCVIWKCAYSNCDVHSKNKS